MDTHWIKNDKRYKVASKTTGKIMFICGSCVKIEDRLGGLWPESVCVDKDGSCDICGETTGPQPQGHDIERGIPGRVE